MASPSACTQAAFPLRVNDFACWVDLGGKWYSHLGLGLIRGLTWGHLQAPIRGGAQAVTGCLWFGCGDLQAAIEEGDCSKEQLVCAVRCFEEWTFSRYCVREAVTDVVEPLAFFLVVLFVWVFFWVFLGFFFWGKRVPAGVKEALRLVDKDCLLVFESGWWWIVLGWEEAAVLPNHGVWAWGPGCVWSGLGGCKIDPWFSSGGWAWAVPQSVTWGGHAPFWTCSSFSSPGTEERASSCSSVLV